MRMAAPPKTVEFQQIVMEWVNYGNQDVERKPDSKRGSSRGSRSNQGSVETINEDSCSYPDDGQKPEDTAQKGKDDKKPGDKP